MIEITRIIGILLLVGSGSAWAAGVYAESDDALPTIIEQPEQLEPDEPLNETDDPEDDADPMPGQPLPDNGPPPSASEDEEGGSDFAMDLPPDPELRRKMLDELYARLGKAKDVKSAEPIAESIEHLWHMSGSATIDLLIARAEIFADGVDPELSMQILDAVVDLAPEDAEGWHQRGRLYAMRKDYERAATDLRRALSLDDKHYKAWRELGEVLNSIDDKLGANEAFGIAAKINPFLNELRKKPVAVPESDDEGQDI
ncbi:MAG TPA: tetratricopeptide repeat protein [Methyloceanibacter sp.]|jgi:tetratricopeptide (TPR) repeat protein